MRRFWRRWGGRVQVIPLLDLECRDWRRGTTRTRSDLLHERQLEALLVQGQRQTCIDTCESCTPGCGPRHVEAVATLGVGILQIAQTRRLVRWRRGPHALRDRGRALLGDLRQVQRDTLWEDHDTR